MEPSPPPPTPTNNEEDDDNDNRLGPIRTQALHFPSPSPPSTVIHLRERPYAMDPAYGLHTWPSARKLARCLYRLATRKRPGLFRGRGVIELGCGTALPGLLLAHAAMGARRVLLTDRADAPHVLGNARAAIALNGFVGGGLSSQPPSPSSSSSCPGTATIVDVAPLSWGQFPLHLPAAHRDGGAFDVILAADCCYHDDGEAGGNEAFLATVTHLLRAGTVARQKRKGQEEEKGGGGGDDDAYFPVLYLAYPERGSGPSLRVALLRWGLEANMVELGEGEEDQGEEDREEGYRVHIVEVRLMESSSDG